MAENANTHTRGRKNWIRNPDWWIVILTTLLLIVGIITARFFYSQLAEMSRQTKILSTQAQQAASDSVAVTQRTEQQLGIAQRQATAAQDSVEAVRRQMREDQRAWLFPLNPPIPPLRIGADVTVPLIITNMGKTPAIDVDAISSFYKVEYEGPRPSEAAALYSHTGTLFPQEQTPVTPIAWQQFATTPKKPGPTDERGIPFRVSVDDYKDFMSGKAFLAFRTDITYNDVFGIHHWLKYCYAITYVPPVKITDNIKECSNHNDVDRN
jgi:hypothetical protein